MLRCLHQLDVPSGGCDSVDALDGFLKLPELLRNVLLDGRASDVDELVEAAEVKAHQLRALCQRISDGINS